VRWLYPFTLLKLTRQSAPALADRAFDGGIVAWTGERHRYSLRIRQGDGEEPNLGENRKVTIKM